MADHPRCIDCPAVSRCVVEWTGHRTYCDWAKRGGAWLARVLEISEAGPADHQAQQPTTDRPTAAESLSLLAAAKACPFRSIDAACGCSGIRCALRHGAILSLQDCMACVTTYGEPGA